MNRERDATAQRLKRILGQCVNVEIEYDDGGKETLTTEERLILDEALSARSEIAPPEWVKAAFPADFPAPQSASAPIRGACHDAAERDEGCFRAVRAERELAEMTEAMREWRDKAIEAPRSSRPEPELVTALNEMISLVEFNEDASMPGTDTWTALKRAYKALADWQDATPAPLSATAITVDHLREVRKALDYKWPDKRGQGDAVMNYEMWRNADDAVEDARRVIDRIIHEQPPTTVSAVDRTGA